MSHRAAFASGLGLLAVVLTVGALGSFALFGEGPGEPTPAPAAVEPPVDSTRFDAGVASRTMDRLRLFRTGNAGEELELIADEITAMLRHGIPGLVPSGVSDPRVALEGGTVHVTARVSSEAFPESSFLTPLFDVLPDTLDVEVHGTIVREPGRLAFRVERVTAAHVPVPETVVASVVRAIGDGGSATASVPRGALPTLLLAWPSGVADLFVSGDRLVLQRSGVAAALVDGDAP